MNEEKLKLWATEGLAGCDGGDIENAKVWLCGIEPGYKKDDLNESESKRQKYYSEDILEEIKESKKYSGEIYNFESLNKHPFNRQFAKLYSEIRGIGIENYLVNLPFFNKQDVFKLNLFPIAFRRDHNSQWKHYNLQHTFTMFENKENYRNWCREVRFPYFKKLIKMHNPDIIICTGLSYLNDFIKSFGDDDLRIEDLSEYSLVDSSLSNSKVRKVYQYRLSNGTQFFVLPFFMGRYGLNSHNLLKQVGEIMHKKIYGEKTKSVA